MGDIIKFEKAGLPITHRLIGIVQDGNKTYYVTHGDNNPKLTGAEDDSWQANAKVIEGKSYAEISSMSNIEISPRENVEGKVIGWFSNYGTYVDYIKNHTLVIVAIFLGVWCISSAYQNEAELKRMRRLA